MEMCLPLGIISLSGFTKTTHLFSSSCIVALAPVLSQIFPILRGMQFTLEYERFTAWVRSLPWQDIC